jgi:ABC-type multidrug transport system ATPase subunit
MLTVNRLQKTYSDSRGIKALSFSVDSGEIASFVGPNGAGKTTLFRTLAGAAGQYSGQCLLNGRDISIPRAENKISWLDETPFAFPEMTPVQFALYIREMKGLDTAEAELEELMESFELSGHKNRKIRTLSQGMQRKAAVLPIFLGTPELLVLDEPTNGLDTRAVITLKQLLLKEKAAGAAILLSSHILDFVGNVSDTVYFLKGGEICAKEKPADTGLEDAYRRLFLQKTEKTYTG